MKPRIYSLFGSIAFIATPFAHAIQPPADDAPPPPPISVGEVDVNPPREEKIQPQALPENPEAIPAYLGVSVAPIPELLGAHLELPERQGVLVRIVAPGSPAAQAGVQVHDILLQVDGHAVMSHAELLDVVSRHRAGDVIPIKILRKGEEVILEATLAARPEALNMGQQENPRMGVFPLAPEDLFFDELPQDHAARIRDMIEQNLRALRDPGGMFDDEMFQGAFDNVREQMEQLLAEPKPFGPLNDDGEIGNFRMNAGATVRLMDDEGSVELKAVDGSKEVTVRDLQNEILWAGPWDTEQDKAAAPDEIRQRVERLNIEGFEQGNGLKLQFFRNR